MGHFPRSLAAGLALAGALAACGDDDPARQLVRESIEVHGGEAFEQMDLTFTFRDVRFRVRRDAGRFHYERSFTSDDGREVREWLTNEGVGREVDGAEVSLGSDQQEAVERAVNSVVYFGFLPFRLLDPAVVLRELEGAEVEGRPYRKVEATFRREGGGMDWEDRFVYWFHRDERTLDYLAYRYHTGEGGTRFRRAVARREVGPLLVQDYENFTADPVIDDIAHYDRFFEGGRLDFISTIQLENVRFTAPDP